MESTAVIENLILALSPKWAAARSAARLRQQQAIRLLDAGKDSPYRRRPRGQQSANAVTDHGAIAARSFARYLDENHDLCIGILDLLETRITHGLSLEPLTESADLNQRFRDTWLEFCESPAANGEMDFLELSRLMARSWLRDGESFCRDIYGPNVNALGYALQPLEADYVPFDDYRTPKNSDGWIHGIQFDSLGKPLRYKVLRAHPGDIGAYSASFLENPIVVEAGEMAHLKFTRRLHQARGVSILHGVINRLDDMKDVEESERIAMRVNANFAAAIKRGPYFEATNAQGEDTRSFEMHPGAVWDLLPDEEIMSIKSERPNTNLPPFLDLMTNRIAAGTKTNASSISRNYNGSYSAQRQGVSDANPGYDMLFRYFSRTLVKRTYAKVLQAAALQGRFPSSALQSKYAYRCDIRHQPPAEIDGERESKKHRTYMNMRVKSRHQIIRELGGDPATVDQQIANDPYREAYEQNPGQARAPEERPEDD